jgi:hypothetical protein
MLRLNDSRSECASRVCWQRGTNLLDANPKLAALSGQCRYGSTFAFVIGELLFAAN